ncbi:CPCC family cysteine-rich protein [Rosenbergiella collisarenosi]|uniref:CPCC family cysteine-rich protein n=1 Tax=Rosenbergiella collisarenosi TaxID=1544695 RepID=UPI001F4D47C4|nr:CPCC family cysteine-rich protein [Rosenbergiella collisarenosi]
MKHNKESLYQCPCCKKHTLATYRAYEICKLCNWEDDPLQSDNPDYAGGANITSLHEAQINIIKKITPPEN